MGVHDGHRKRMKNRFVEHGLLNFDDHAVLELLLFYAIPRADTNVVAHALMDRFGKFHAVLDAPRSQLMEVAGIGEDSATLLNLIPQVCQRYMMSQNGDFPVLDSTTAAGRFCLPLFIGQKEELLFLICLDAGSRVMAYKEMARGGVDSVELNVRKIAEVALNAGAASIIIAHNHTTGVALPSVEDEATTRHLRMVLQPLEIELRDHIVVAGNDFISMADSGFFEQV